MKSLKFLLGGAGILAFLTLAACTADEPDEAYSAKKATVTSTDPAFVADATGGTVSFATGGNTVVISVACDVDWEAVNDSPDWLEANASVSAGTLTLTAAQNTVESERTATVTLQTSESGVRFATLNITQNAYGAPELSTAAAEWHAPAVGALTTTIAVNATEDWTAEVEAGVDWLTAEKDGDSLKLTAAENEEAETREADVTVTCTDGIRTLTQTIAVTQDGLAYVTLGAETLALSGESQSATVSVESNFDLAASCDASWLTVTVGSNGATVTVTENDGDVREAAITFTAGDGAENTAEAQLTVTQRVVGADALIIEFTTTTTNREVMLPITGTVDCTIDWGDDSDPVTVTDGLPTHTYVDKGTYEATINGTVTQISSESLSTTQRGFITGVLQWGYTGLTSMEKAFYSCTKVAALPETTGTSFADVTTFSNAFYSCSALTSIPADLFADCPDATAFDYVLYKCSKLTEIPSGLFSKCPEVTTFEYAFGGCSVLTAVPEGIFSAAAKVITFSHVFYQAKKIDTLPENLFAGCTAATEFDYAFYQCAALTEIPKGIFAGCTAAENFDNLFYYCTGLLTIPDGMFAECPNALNFNKAFYYCSKLTNLPKDTFSGCSKATIFDYVMYKAPITEIPEGLFDDCVEALTFENAFYSAAETSIPEGLFANCTKATSFLACFQSNTGITAVPVGLFANCPNVTSFEKVFYGDTALTTVPVGIFDNNLKVESFYWAFYNCKALTGESPYSTLSDGTKVHLYERKDHTADGFTAPSSYTKCFYNCSGLDDYSDITSAGWN